MLLLGLVDVPLWVLLTMVILVTLYILGTWNHDHFKKRGVPGPRPLPFIGTLYNLFLYDLYTVHLKLKKKYGKTYGTFSGSKAGFVTFDEEILSEVMVKQFHNFTDRRPQSFGDPEFEFMLTILQGDHWRHVRSQMSPAFTTGKLRRMAVEINRCGKALAKNLVSIDGPFEARDCAGAFTMDVIASTAFGLRINSQEDKNNPFVTAAQKIADFDIRSFMFVFFLLCPRMMPYLAKLGFRFMDRSATDLFINVIEQALEGRAHDEDQTRADFLQLMLRAQEGHDIHDKEQEDEVEKGEGEGKEKSRKGKGLSKEEILSNALLFFVAGQSTTEIAVSKLMYLLACNQDCQQLLIEELDSALGDKEIIDYDTAMKLPYLHQCIQETLRLYPPAVFADREAKDDVEVCGIKMSKGDLVLIPIIGIHHDPDIWPEPEKFDPDRFSPENREKINPFHWMPFGYGPRNCIGMRLALFEIKIAIATLLRTHRLVTCDKTEIPLKISKFKMMKPLNGIWLAVEKRTDK